MKLAGWISEGGMAAEGCCFVTGHDLSRAAKPRKELRALAPEGCSACHFLAFPHLSALRVAAFAVLIFLACATLPAAAKDAPRSFSLSTSRTFSPGESVKIQLFARNVPELEFRVYKVKDAGKFFAGLKDLHSFGASR